MILWNIRVWYEIDLHQNTRDTVQAPDSRVGFTKKLLMEMTDEHAYRPIHSISVYGIISEYMFLFKA